jgi:hypothetical protein
MVRGDVRYGDAHLSPLGAARERGRARSTDPDACGDAHRDRGEPPGDHPRRVMLTIMFAIKLLLRTLDSPKRRFLHIFETNMGTLVAFPVATLFIVRVAAATSREPHPSSAGRSLKRRRRTPATKGAPDGARSSVGANPSLLPSTRPGRAHVDRLVTRGRAGQTHARRNHVRPTETATRACSVGRASTRNNTVSEYERHHLSTGKRHRLQRQARGVEFAPSTDHSVSSLGPYVPSSRR